MSKKDKQYYADKIAETIGVEDEDIQETFETYERIWDASNHFINLVGMEEITERKKDPCATWYDMFTAFVCHMMLRTDKKYVADLLKDTSGRLDWYEEWNQNRVDEGGMVAMSAQELQDKQDAMIERVVNEEIIH